MKIGVVSDIHYGFAGLNEEKIEEQLQNLVQTFIKNNVSHIVLLGDLIHEQSETIDEKNLRTVYSIFDSQEEFSSVVAVAGNHDVVNLSENQFEDIVNHPVNYQYSTEDVTITCIDTAFAGPIQNVGQISDEGLQLVEQTQEETIIFTHYPITYTDGYQESPYFGEYPEGVFAINKFSLDYMRDTNNCNISHIVTGHLHMSQQYVDSHGVQNTILEPFSELRTENPSESYVNGVGKILDTDTQELTDCT